MRTTNAALCIEATCLAVGSTSTGELHEHVCAPFRPRSYGGSGLLLLQVVADYTRLSAVQNRLGGLDSVATDHADE
jgi:hypothetical protein